MRNRAVLAAGLVGLVGLVVLGLIATWQWRRDRPAPPEAAAQTSPARAAGAVAPWSGGGAAAAPVILEDDDPIGPLRVEGQVVDADGHGAAGVTVAISSGPPRTVVTEGDGSFAFDRLLGRSYVLVAHSPKGIAGPIAVRVTDHSEPVMLRLRPGSSVMVAVVRKDGKPADGAVVELRGVEAQRAAIRGGSSVFSPVVPGRYQLAAWADGTARAYLGIDVGRGDNAAQLVLLSGAAATGRVVDERGRGVAGARLVLRGASEWQPQADERWDAVMTVGDGGFRFDAIPAGSFRFVVTHPESAPGASPLITFDGVTPRDGVVITLTAGTEVRGRVVDGQQRPVASARVQITGLAGTSAIAGAAPWQTYSDAGGAFELRGLPRRKLSAVARHDVGASQPVEVDTARGDVSNVTLTLDVTGVIAGTVVDPQNKPVEGVRVMTGLAVMADGGLADAGRGRLRDFPEDQSDASGSFKLTGLVDGQYRLVALPPSRTAGRGDLRSAVTASTGDTNVRLVVAPDGGVKGRVALASDRAPGPFHVAVEQTANSFLGGDGSFALDSLAPGHHQLEVRGIGFVPRTIDITVESSETVDLGTISVVEGRSLAGTVVANGQPVAGARVYAGRTLIGTGTDGVSPSAGQPTSPAGDDTMTAVTDARGAFSISGLGGGDLTVLAEQADIGRSRALRIPELMPGQSELTISLEKFGALRGTLRQSGQPTGIPAVTCQSTSTPGAIYRVLVAEDAAFRFDRLAPDVYKVSVMLPTARFGARFYSQQVTVESGQEATVDLSADPGTVTLTVTVTASSGAVGAGSAWLASGAITAGTTTDLMLKLASAGPGTSARIPIASGEPKQFSDLSAGLYSVCITPAPREVKGQAAVQYMMSHSNVLATFCKQITIAASPTDQSVQVEVEVPAMLTAPDRTAGSGAASKPPAKP
jgi:hypothetical protein